MKGFGVKDTNENQRFIDHFEGDAEELEKGDEGDAETLSVEERSELADENRLRAQDYREDRFL